MTEKACTCDLTPVIACPNHGRGTTEIHCPWHDERGTTEDQCTCAVSAPRPDPRDAEIERLLSKLQRIRATLQHEDGHYPSYRRAILAIINEG